MSRSDICFKKGPILNSLSSAGLTLPLAADDTDYADVERRWIESADRIQLVKQLRPDDRSSSRRRREINPASCPLRPAVAVGAVGAGEQLSPGDHIPIAA